MLNRALLIIVAAGSAATLPAQAKSPESLPHVGRWMLNYDPDACHLLARFGVGDDQVIMRLTRYELGDYFSLSLYGRKFASKDVTGTATFDFGLGSGPVKVGLLAGGTGEDLAAMFFDPMRLDGWKRTQSTEIPPAMTPRQEASVSGMTVHILRQTPFRLEFGSLGKPMEQLRACQADLVKSWGYDPAVQATLSRPVLSLNGTKDWLKSSDYPVGALFKRQNALLHFRLDVDAVGKVVGCRILNRIKSDVFGDATCQAVIKRAKLTPALDASGNPVRSFLTTRVNWLVQ